MMRKIEFGKAVASGNDFIIIDKPQLPITKLARKLCARKLSIGADGLLLVSPSRKADIKMRIFNPDGSEAEMCGNGARCVALWAKSKSPCLPAGRKSQKSKVIKIETKAGIIDSKVNSDKVKIKLTDPKNIKLNFPIKVNKRTPHVNFINTGVPHTVIFVEGLDKIDVVNLGRQIRQHRRFKPAGTNVDFVEILNNHSISIRTYERGVEDETLACGTGAVACALITNYQLPITNYSRINVHTQSGEILKVYFERAGNKFTNVWLEGKAKIVYKGEYYV